jgi:RHS repeat-associated protein
VRERTRAVESVTTPPALDASAPHRVCVRIAPTVQRRGGRVRASAAGGPNGRRWSQQRNDSQDPAARPVALDEQCTRQRHRAMLANMFAMRRLLRALALALFALLAIAPLLAPSRAGAATPSQSPGRNSFPVHPNASAHEAPKRREVPVFPCRAQRAPNRNAATLQRRSLEGACEHGFGEDRRRAGPTNQSTSPLQRRQCRGRAPASWGNGAGQRFSEENPDGNDPDYTGDLGGYAYSAFGKRLPASEVGGLPPPAGFSQPFTWQGKRGLGGNLYYSRARIWSADLGVFLQPDQYAYLRRGGTLWSWPGQNPFRWADPSGRALAGRFDEGSRFLGDAAGWLASNAMNEWGQGNYGAAALDFGAAFATGVASLFASPAMDLAGFGTVGGGIRAGAAAAAKECSKAVAKGAKPVAGLLSDVTVVSRGKVVGRGTVDLRGTLEGIESGKIGARDVFRNREGLLPPKPGGYYQEFLHPTPGVQGAGSQRIIQGQSGELFYTPDHYKSFIPLN